MGVHRICGGCTYALGILIPPLGIYRDLLVSFGELMADTWFPLTKSAVSDAKTKPKLLL